MSAGLLRFSWNDIQAMNAGIKAMLILSRAMLLGSWILLMLPESTLHSGQLYPKQ